MEPPVAPERLFDSHRLPSEALLRVSLLLYAPVGLCLLLLRLFLGLHVFLVSCALPEGRPRRLVVRAMCVVLGLLVRQSHPGGQEEGGGGGGGGGGGQQQQQQQEQQGRRTRTTAAAAAGRRRRRPPPPRVIVANHVTPFDHNALRLVASCSAPVLNGSSGFLCWSRGFLEVGGAENRTELLESLKAYSAQGDHPPLLLFPEETTTNGRVGLLRFSTWPFSIMDTVHPVALQVQRPFVAVSVADASWVTELLWTFFVPFTIYQVRWLPAVCRADEETREDFAHRVQELLAVELGMATTRLTAADKAEHLKRQRHSRPSFYSLPAPPAQLAEGASQAPPRAVPVEDGHLLGMGQRVKEVLPHVPLAVIHKDLAQTNCVDATIANLLEGRVPFLTSEGEPGAASTLPSVSGAHPSTASSPATAAAKVFARSPEARHLSLQERKWALYDYARRKYTEKYGVAQREGTP